mmetsp:Transcript_74/g.142  ORF Transcript_74/g.142 Transcript_74/m.142 type:complete len:459 (+) Transcript_74:145-1521(+)|eukprot:CAMPEP_0178995906 /NCGR_PEP_ID=MMETSP0795-20121207/8074_1 /TAXON_ID=88552 /ORGANISM="Amoebophrya sp., Strain Ameob2" /LENGTH=458 /DNA_ID=CAMNT_0020688239 /DNA_START=73 /DNA_END=1449 /DNA_ORIENTATION=-
MAPTSSDPKAEFLTTAALRKLPAKVLKKLLLKHHPDKGGEKEAFQRVFEQYSLKKQAEELEAKTPVAGVVPRKHSDGTSSTTTSSGNAPASKNQHTSRHRDADAYFKRPPSAKRFDPGDREHYSDTRVYNDGVFYEKYFGAGGGKKEGGVDDEDLMKRFANLRTRSGVGVEKKAGAAGSTPSSSSTTSSRKNSNSNGSSATNGTSRWDWQPPGAAPAGGVGGEKRRASGTGAEAGASSSANKGGKPTTTRDARNRPSGAPGGNSSPGKSTPSAGGGPSSRSTRAGAGAGKTTPAKTKAAEKQKTFANKAEEQPVDWAQVKKRWLKQELLLEHLRHQLKHSKTRDAEDERILNSLLKSEQSLVHEFSTECSGSSKSGSKSSSRDGRAAGEQEDDEAENEGLQIDQEHQEDEEDVEDSFFGAGGAGLGSTSDELSKVDELLQEHEEAMLDMLFEEYTTSS